MAMECLSLFVGILSLFNYFCEIPTLDEKKRKVKGATEFLEAKMEDISREFSLRRGKKRKVDDHQWMEEGDRIIREAKRVLTHPVGKWKSFFMGAKVRWDLYSMSCAINAHSKKVDLVHTQALSDTRVSFPGGHLPVKELVGVVASRTLDRLEHLLEGDEIGRIVIHGIEGIGKTDMMKHLHNYALNLFESDCVFWVPFSSPVEFSIKTVQDAIAVVVNCQFGSDDDIFVRARKLSDKFAEFGRFALYLDGVPKSDFSVEGIGIPVPVKGSDCKLVLATSAQPLGWSSMDSFEIVEVENLPEDSAYALFIREANIREESVATLGDIPRSLSNSCGGVPREIVKLASTMCNIDDPCEWRCAQFELRRLGKKKRRLS